MPHRPRTWRRSATPRGSRSTRPPRPRADTGRPRGRRSSRGVRTGARRTPAPRAVPCPPGAADRSRAQGPGALAAHPRGRWPAPRARPSPSRDPEKARGVLEELATDLEDALQELRDLAHGIYPPLLADKGLPEALASAARRSALPVTIDAPGVGRYPPEVEAAVYFCCLEALQNAAKYAGDGASVTIRVWEQEGGLLFEVSDDGAGFEVRQRSAGAGFTNMSDRLGAIGGSMQVE